MRSLSAFFLAACLAACSTITRGGDAQIASLAQDVGNEADTFYARLFTETAPECDLAHNVAGYDHLDAIAARLQARSTQVKGGPALDRAIRALSQTLADARESHRLASAIVADEYGVCMATGAIELNRGAVSRASAAIAASQTQQGDQ